MRKRLLDYLKMIDTILEQSSNDENWDNILGEHLIQIGFFQHERLIHLIVTVVFAIILFITMILMTISFSIPLIVLFFTVLILLVPYIRHYYLLENGVQKMYTQYEQILEKIVKNKV